jgi:hypothetical protein
MAEVIDIGLICNQYPKYVCIQTNWLIIVTVFMTSFNSRYVWFKYYLFNTWAAQIVNPDKTKTITLPTNSPLIIQKKFSPSTKPKRGVKHYRKVGPKATLNHQLSIFLDFLTLNSVAIYHRILTTKLWSIMRLCQEANNLDILQSTDKKV